MKKFFFTILTCLLILCSCSEDSTNDQEVVNVTASDITGVWNLDEFYSENGKISGTIQGIPVNANLEITSKDYINTTTTFTTDPNKVFNNGSMVVVTKISGIGEGFSEEEGIIFDPNIKGDWDASGKTLSLPIQLLGTEQTIEAEILEFTESTMKVKAILEQAFTLPDAVSQTLPLPVKDVKIATTLRINFTK